MIRALLVFYFDVPVSLSDVWHHTYIRYNKELHHAKKQSSKSGPLKEDCGSYRGSYNAISNCFTVSRTTVCCIIAKYKETHSVKNKPVCGRKCKISGTGLF